MSMITLDDVPVFKFKDAQLYLNKLQKLNVTPPHKDGKYKAKPAFYMMPDGSTEYFSEKQVNLATHIAAGSPLDESVVMAGYAYLSHFKSPTSKRIDIQKNILSMGGRLCTEKVQALANALAVKTLDKLVIDATWLLNEQINLFRMAKSMGQLATAARILNDISTHVQVDAKVSNKLVLEDTVDYAAVLSSAAKRIENKPKLIALEGLTVNG